MLLIFTQTLAVRAVKSTGNDLNQVRKHDAAVPLPLEEMKWDPNEDSTPLADTDISSEAELDVITKSFDEEIREFISNQDVWGRIMESTPDRGLGTLSRVDKRMRILCEEDLKKRKSYQLELLRRNPAVRTDHALKSQMDPTEEIEHYLNGFDTRMFGWMMMFYRDSDDPVKQQIAEFATKLAQDRATLFRLPPHRRGAQKEIPWFDAFFRMYDNNMVIFDDRMRKDHIMWDYDDPRADPSSLSWERKAFLEIMKIMETIGVVIAYPGLQEMQKVILDSHGNRHFGFSQNNRRKVQEMLVCETNITVLLQWEFDWYGGRKSLMEVLSRDSCIGRKAKDDVVANVQTFVRELKESGWSRWKNIEASCRSACSVQ